MTLTEHVNDIRHPWLRLLGILAFGTVCCFLVRCSSTPETKRAAAAASYGAMVTDCIRKAKVDMVDQSDAARARARAQYDACADNVDALWAKDGGAR